MIETADTGVGTVEQDRSRNVRAAASAESLPLHALLLIAALAGALVSQGAYYRQAQWPVIVLLAAALIVAVRAHPWSITDTRFPPLAVCAVLAGWAAVRAAAAGDVGDGMGVVALSAGVAATVVVARRTSDVAALGSGVVALGVVTALTGWVGVAWRLSPWALEDQGLWRAATSLTYANAAAGVLGAVALVALARLVARPESRVTALSVCVLLAGLGATLSRGGRLAFAVGGLLLAALLGVRSVARALQAPGIGAAVALAGLVPSMSRARPRTPCSPRWPSLQASASPAGSLAAGAAVVALVPSLPAVGQRSPPVGQQSPPRVTICHNPGTPAVKTMTLPLPAAQGHFGHGDVPGPCPSR